MNDEEKTKAQLISEMQIMRRQLEHLETLQRQYEKTLRDSQHQLQQAQKMETLGTLVAGVAHEINNPINLIMYNIPLLQKIWADFMPVLKERQQREPDQKFGGFDYDFLTDNLVQLVADMEMAAHRDRQNGLRFKKFLPAIQCCRKGAAAGEQRREKRHAIGANHPYGPQLLKSISNSAITCLTLTAISKVSSRSF